MQAVEAAIVRLAPSRATVLVTGEAGAGKSRVARALHERSGRRPFVTVDCPSLAGPAGDAVLFGGPAHLAARRRGDPLGALHAADGGTLFLREVLELPLAVQPRLLRFLDEGEPMEDGDRDRRLDVRILVSSSGDLDRRMRKGRFRRDLGERLGLVRLAVPPLRERVEDHQRLVADLLREEGLDPLRSVDLAALGGLPSVRALRDVLRALGTGGDATTMAPCLPTRSARSAAR
jgi:DNA-binding NtrC family response regulator